MRLYFRSYTENDFSHELLGKPKRYRLKRGEAEVVVKGVLLAYYNVANDGLGQVYHKASYIDRMALFKTGSGKFVIYYIIEYVGNAHQDGKRQYVKVFGSHEEAKSFISNMNYPNAESFREEFLKENEASAA